VRVLADELRHDTFAVVGNSSGGPYAMSVPPSSPTGSAGADVGGVTDVG
jgi:hypothetical protein